MQPHINGNANYVLPEDYAIQDSENNNVDENSNDQQYNDYAHYHQQFSNHQFISPDQSVRPRVITSVTPAGSSSLFDEPDRSPIYDDEEDFLRRRRRRNSSHRRNLSDPPLPSLSPPASITDPRRLPTLPSGPPRDSIRSNWLTLSLRGGPGAPGPPSYEETEVQTRELLENFTFEAFHRNQLEIPSNVLTTHG